MRLTPGRSENDFLAGQRVGNAEAQRAGFDEVVLLNERGEVSECTAANIFAVKAGK